MKAVIAAVAAALLLATAGPAFAQNSPPAKTEKQKGPAARAAVDCKKAENANNKECMKGAKDQAAASKTKKKATTN